MIWINREDFCKIDWDKVIHENDNNINNAFNSFYKTRTEIRDHYAPLIRITKKEQTLHLKPWINKEIQYLMWKRDKLFRMYCARKDLIQKNIIHHEFKSLGNIVTYETRKSNKMTSEAATQRCSVKKVFLDISQNSQVFSCEFCEIS